MYQTAARRLFEEEIEREKLAHPLGGERIPGFMTGNPEMPNNFAYTPASSFGHRQSDNFTPGTWTPVKAGEILGPNERLDIERNWKREKPNIENSADFFIENCGYINTAVKFNAENGIAVTGDREWWELRLHGTGRYKVLIVDTE
jgi:hypothetical protein